MMKPPERATVKETEEQKCKRLEAEREELVAAEKDPPNLAELLAYHPGLTREEALEMLREAGG
jgi:hypothetical protein